MRFVLLMLTTFGLMAARSVHADEATALVQAVIEQAGGEDKLLNIFRFRERVLITSTPVPLPAPDEKGNRTSVVQVGGDWWLGKSKRDKDKVRVLLWAWSLRILTDTKAKVALLPDSDVAGKPAVGLRVTEATMEPIELYFDKTTRQLLAIDYTDTRHLFSEWTQTEAGFKYPKHVVGYRFVDRKMKTLRDQQWYQTDILELTPLTELPPELKP